VATDTFDEIEAWFLKEVQSLHRQAKLIYEQQVVPTWGDDDLLGFRHALYGFMMNTMALLDRLSCYHAGKAGCIPASRGRRLEYATLAYNVTGVVILAVAATSARSR
jgi:hypothetical protein